MFQAGVMWALATLRPSRREWTGERENTGALMRTQSSKSISLELNFKVLNLAFSLEKKEILE